MRYTMYGININISTAVRAVQIKMFRKPVKITQIRKEEKKKEAPHNVYHLRQE